MENESKFLDIQYLETRLRDFKEIKNNSVKFDIEKSNRTFSKSLYIEFKCLGINSVWHKYYTMRISDHALPDYQGVQFVIEPTTILTKKKKQEFIRDVEYCIRCAKKKSFNINLKKI